MVRLAIILATISTVIFTWCWTYKLVARHRKAIQTTQTPSTSQNIARKRSVRSHNNCIRHYCKPFDILLSKLVLDFFENTFKSQSSYSGKIQEYLANSNDIYVSKFFVKSLFGFLAEHFLQRNGGKYLHSLEVIFLIIGSQPNRSTIALMFGHAERQVAGKCCSNMSPEASHTKRHC